MKKDQEVCIGRTVIGKSKRGKQRNIWDMTLTTEVLKKSNLNWEESRRETKDKNK